MEKNLTTGSVFNHVVLFSLPYLLSYFLQTLCGFSREIALIDYGITNDTEKFVTEICIPVRPAQADAL